MTMKQGMLVYALLLLGSCLLSCEAVGEAKDNRQQEPQPQQPQQQQEQQHRLLQRTCPRDDSMTVDALWYEMQITISSRHNLQCSTAEQREIGQFLENEIENADLWHFNMHILDLQSHICSNPLIPTRRQLEPFTTTTNTTTTQDNVLKERARNLAITASAVHIFLGGGGRCVFCREDDDDANGKQRRRQLDKEDGPATNLRGNSNQPLLEHVPERESDDFRELLESLEEQAYAMYKQDMENEQEPVLGNSTNNVHYASTQDDDNIDNDNRRLRCGGCKTLNFERNGQNRVISGTPYVATREYWNSHGVEIKAYPASGSGYAPGHKARLYDTDYRASNDYYGDPDLGSPNQYCGGHGVGYGGRPRVNGRRNPGANCQRQGNILILQESNKPYADDNARGGRIVFTFRYTVTLREVGFMDMLERNADYIKLTLEGNQIHRHDIVGYGKNSISTMQLNLQKVKKMEIFFRGPGAIRHVKFCHDCGTRERERTVSVQKYYPSPQVRSYENQATVQEATFEFNSVMIYLRAYLKIRMWTEYNKPNKRNHCLYRKYPDVYIQMLASTPVAANNCHQF